ncbi:MAG TPA: SDR family oxidoreductase [Vicinamibacteria bacterium]|nr:SDR family oxidoreductase [Vicinamibacteria bacterium]
MSRPDGPDAGFRALVTGASSGIGVAFARALKAKGERLVLVARRRDRLQELSRELGGEDTAAVLAADLTEPGAIDRLAEEIHARGFTVDLLVNNAGAGHTSRFHEERRETVLGMIDLNVRALVALTHAFLPGMVARGRGRVINVASNAAFQPVPFLTVYAATKAFVLSFTEGLASELAGTGVRVQALCPGLTATEFLEVAETGSGLLINRMPAMSAEDVVACSLRALERGRLRVVAGLTNRLLAGVQRFVPRSIVRGVAAELYRPRSGRPS